MLVRYIRQLENKTRLLEDVIRKLSPTDSSRANISSEDNNQPVRRDFDERTPEISIQNGQYGSLTHPASQLQQTSKGSAPEISAVSPTANSPAHSISSQIGPRQPLAHDVGLLSLTNSAEPKYLGPSSGVTFARLIFAAAPQSQGLPSSHPRHEIGNISATPVELSVLPKEEEMRYFVDAYFETWHPLYPFLHESLFQDLVTRVQSHGYEIASAPPHTLSQTMDVIQLFLVIALGAKILESRLSANFSSDSYYATAMFHISKIQLHDSIRGIQVLLLLVLSSFSFPNGLNAWFLNSTIIASCLDLGLQRKDVDGKAHYARPSFTSSCRLSPMGRKSCRALKFCSNEK